MAQKQRSQSDRAGWAELISVIFLSFYPIATPAQMVGDSTLGTQVNGSEVNPCTGVCIITNGTTRGSNLFHSFRQFSLPNQDVAGFITTSAIQNVIVRVTGVGQPFISTINGTIATSNPANFFLLNPNGIIFGPGAFLDIGGTFLATTADRMRFADGTEFLTDAPTPLLTVSVPIGLQLSQTPKNIQMQGTFFSAGDKDRFRDFALIGGDVLLDNSFIAAPGQRVALAGAGENGAVGLQLNGDRLRFNLAADISRRDISVVNSRVDTASAGGGGWVEMVGHNITLNRSYIATGISPGLGNASTNRAGDITINAVANLQLTRRSVIVNPVLPNAIGQGGNVDIAASDIRVSDGSVIVAATQGTGNAGSVRVAANTIAIDGTTPDSQFVSGITSQVSGPTARGRGGDVIVRTGLLTITNGANINSSTFGNGDAGNVQIIANTIALNGTTPNGQFGSGIFSQVSRPTAVGNGGSVNVQANTLTIAKGASVSSSTFGNGNAGSVRIRADSIAVDGTTPNGQFASTISSQIGRTGRGSGGEVTIETGSLTLTNGALVSAITSGIGNAGNVRIIANTIAVDGRTPDDQFPTAITSGVNPRASGRGGDVTIATNLLTISNRAEISATNFSSGRAGNLNITARTIQLDHSAISARAASGDGANITLNLRDLLLLRNASEISTSAGTAQAGGDGGNITINVPRGFIVGVLAENSDITANAFTGRGGNVQITAQGIFGIEFQPAETPSSDITASSQFGINGTVVLNTPDLDPTRGTANLPSEPRSPELQEGCQVGGRGTSRFIRTGRGGLPTSPDERLNSMESLDDVSLPDRWATPTTSSGKKTSVSRSPTSIVEAQNWLINDRGEILLVGEIPPCIQAEAVSGRTGE
jgi:filamentous hemagglutinin family protein